MEYLKNYDKFIQLYQSKTIHLQNKSVKDWNFFVEYHQRIQNHFLLWGIIIVKKIMYMKFTAFGENFVTNIVFGFTPYHWSLDSHFEQYLY